MHLAGIELGLGLQVLERFVGLLYHNLFVNQVAVSFATCLYDGQYLTVVYGVVLLCCIHFFAIKCNK